MTAVLPWRDAGPQAVDRARRGLSLSAWLNQAAARALRLEAGRAAVAAWEKRHGALTAEEIARADAVLDRGSRPTRRR